MAQSIQEKIIRRIHSQGEGTVFAPGHFADLGSRSSVDLALKRLVDKGSIRRLARGLYDYPKIHPDLGELTPSVDAVAKALKSKEATRLQPSGAHAAYLLGLTEQVPMRAIFLTDGRNRKITISGKEISLKHTTPKNMATAGTISGTVYQALRWLGKPHVDQDILNKLKDQLSPEQKDELRTNLSLVPAWVADCFRQITLKEPARNYSERFLSLSRSDVRVYCEEAEARCGLPAMAIEKDFWICWALHELVQLPEIGQHLTFKGGTSLSKGWKLIKRFSEDIDLIVDKEPLGFGGDNDPEKAPSNKQKKKRKQQLKKSCQEFVTNQLMPLFLTVLKKRLGYPLIAV